MKTFVYKTLLIAISFILSFSLLAVDMGDKVSKGDSFETTFEIQKEENNTQSNTSIKLTLLDKSDAAVIKQQAIIIGPFKYHDNAEFVKKTFAEFKEPAVMAKRNNNAYYVLVQHSDEDIDMEKDTGIMQILKDLNNKYSYKYNKAVIEKKSESSFEVKILTK